MTTAPIVYAISFLLIGLVAMIVFYVLAIKAQKKRMTPFGMRHDELAGEKRHCDGYSAGTFTW